MHKISNKDAVASQVEKFTKQLTQMMTEGSSNEIVSAVQVTSSCQVCGDDRHGSHECPVYARQESQIAEVNYTQNQGPYSQSYNPSWRNHPSLSYKNSAQPTSFQNNNQGFRQQNYVPQHASNSPHHQPSSSQQQGAQVGCS